MSRLPVDADAIRALAAILVETGLTEIEVAEKDLRIRVVRAPASVQAVAYEPQPAMETMRSAPAAVNLPAELDLSQHPGAVTSPMVGIAFLTPEPGLPPFVTPGQMVSAGQTLLLIEAMKTFNQIKAPKAGTLAAILVESGAAVEFGEVLAVID
jgi:acetyl-CoA carboxylase biotin carboxyl carrier protein